ncbi:MAG: AI-2E family transporter [Candidatus Glassbacteria bacterium]|nr:AI-2E family transporter [Candidatus Glassbacteria bacterium]
MITSHAAKDVSVIFRPWFKLSMLAVIALSMVTFLLWIPGLLSSFLISIILVYILAPAVDFLERRGWSRIMSILALLFSILAVVILAGVLMSNLLVNEYEKFASNLDEYSTLLNNEFKRRMFDLEKQLGLDRYEAGQHLIETGQEKMSQAVIFTGTTFATLMTWIAVVPLLLFFFLLDGYRIKRTFVGFMPNRYFELTLNIQQKTSEIVGSFIRAKMIESVAVGICAYAGFLVVGLLFDNLNYALFLAILVGVFNVIPYLGPLIGAVPVLLVAIVQYVLLPQLSAETGMVAASAPSWAPVMAVVVVLLFAQAVDNVYLIPVVLGGSVNVHPLIVLLSVLLGAKMLGITGMIISIPLASMVQTVVREVALGIKELRH